MFEPSYAAPYYNRGTCYYLVGNNSQALVDLNKSIELYDGEADYYVNRGLVYSKTGEYLKAMKDWNKALELDPSLENEIKEYIKESTK
jgi:tetratricopeptide (TPR) repeat protein